MHVFKQLPWEGGVDPHWYGQRRDALQRVWEMSTGWWDGTFIGPKWASFTLTDEHSTQNLTTNKHDLHKPRREHETEICTLCTISAGREWLEGPFPGDSKSWVAGRQKSSVKSCVRERVVVVGDVLRTNCRILGSAQRSNPSKNRWRR